MRNFLRVLAFLFLSVSINAQTVAFSNIGLNKTLQVKVTTTQTNIGLENELKLMSEPILPNVLVNVGTVSKYGTYFFTFIFNTSKKTFQVDVWPEKSRAIEVKGGVISTADEVLFTKFKGIFTKDRMGRVLSSSFNQYIGGSVVSGTTTMLVCITAGATLNPVFTIQCAKGVAAEGIAFGKSFCLEVLKDAKTSFTTAEYSKLESIITAGFAATSVVASGFSTTDVIAAIADVSLTNENVKLGVGYSTQLFSKYEFALQLLKK